MTTEGFRNPTTPIGQIEMHVYDSEKFADQRGAFGSEIDLDEFDLDGFAAQFVERASEAQMQMVEACDALGEEACAVDSILTVLWRVSQHQSYRLARPHLEAMSLLRGLEAGRD